MLELCNKIDSNIHETQEFSVLQYLGHKRKLIPFIKENVYNYLGEGDGFLDLFAGTSIVGYNFKKTNLVYSNDAAPFAYETAKALIKNNLIINYDEIKQKLDKYYEKNRENLSNIFNKYLMKEKKLLNSVDINSLIDFYNNSPNYPLNNEKFDKEIDLLEYKKNNKKEPYILFSSYYSSNYFGFHQSIDIDSLKYAIEYGTFSEIEKGILHTSLFYAMNECSFSRDGHFAQVINFNRSKKRLLKTRKKSIYKFFIRKLKEFNQQNFITNKYMYNKDQQYIYNLDYKDVLQLNEIKDNVNLVYADPPYTTNKYSRYYHLLNTLVLYDYPEISKNRNGEYTKGLYRSRRMKSNFCSKVKAINEIENLFNLCKENKKVLILSYAYPSNPEKQNTSRYSASVDDIIKSGRKIFGKDNFKINIKSYEHSNQRKSSNKSVNEFLLIGKY